MNVKIRRMACFLFTIVLMMGATGCTDTVKRTFGIGYEEYSGLIKQTLQEKYGLPFEVGAIGGDRNDATVKAWCYCTEGEQADKKFMAEIGKETKLVEDAYLNLVAADRIAEQWRGENRRAFAVIESDQYAEATDVTTVQDYVGELGNYFVTAHIFVEAPLVDTEKQAAIAYALAETGAQMELRDLMIVVWFVDTMTDDISRTYWNTAIDQQYDVFLEKEYVRSHAVVQIKGNTITTDYDALVSSIK